MQYSYVACRVKAWELCHMIKQRLFVWRVVNARLPRDPCRLSLSAELSTYEYMYIRSGIEEYWFDRPDSSTVGQYQCHLFQFRQGQCIKDSTTVLRSNKSYSFPLTHPLLCTLSHFCDHYNVHPNNNNNGRTVCSTVLFAQCDYVLHCLNSRWHVLNDNHTRLVRKCYQQLNRMLKAPPQSDYCSRTDSIAITCYSRNATNPPTTTDTKQ